MFDDSYVLLQCRSQTRQSNSYNSTAAGLSTFVLDSGSSKHIVNWPKEHFEDYKDVSVQVLTAQEGISMQAKGQGRVRCSTQTDGNRRVTFTLEKALHVPSLRQNLISISKLTDDDGETLFSSRNAKVMLSDGQVICAPRINGLYMFPGTPLLSTVQALMTSSDIHATTSSTSS